MIGSLIVTSLPCFGQDEKQDSRNERLFVHDEIKPDVKCSEVKAETEAVACYKCSEHHRLYECASFRNMSMNERWRFIQDNKLCLRCLRKHSLKRCFSKRQCGVDNCKLPHNLLLHQVNAFSVQAAVSPKNETMLFHKDERKSLFRYIPVKLHGKGIKCICIYRCTFSTYPYTR